MHLLWFDMLTTTNNAIFINFDFIIAILESDQFATSLDAHARKIFTSTVAPFEYNIFKSRKLFGFFDVLFQVIHFTTNSTVETLFAHQNTTA